MTREELAAENDRLRAENAELKKRVAELEALVKALQERLEAAQRAGKRQAGPFSKGAPKANPKRSGRKEGHPPRVHAKVVSELPNPTTHYAGGAPATSFF